jgi:cation diffusion facilitator CzcD-associated flavoprotein CzcO
VSDPGERRYCVIGAGYAGNGVAKALKQAGIPYDHLEATDHVGGNWAHGVYESTHIISSRDSTQYEDFPMPADYPDFPSKEQVWRYLEAYVDHFGLRDNIEFGREVVRVEPLGPKGLRGWRLGLADGEVRHYAGVIVANGHHWKERWPSYPGQFTGQQIHSKRYMRPADLEDGNVLVVGAGNSACDIAVETAQVRGSCDISMRRGNWFFPKTMFGIPTAEIDRWWFPVRGQRTFAKWNIRLRFGSWRRYGLPEPDYRPFDKHPIVNEQILYYLRHGTVKLRRGIERLDGRRVHFTDGTHGDYDVIVWGTGFDIELPFLDHDLFEWEDGVPVRVATMMAPGIANLYVFGLSQPRGGAGPLISRGSEVLAKLVRLQEHLPFPVADAVGRFRKPDSRMLVGVSEVMRDIKGGHVMVPLIERHARRTGRWIEQPEPVPPVPEREAPPTAAAA